MKKCIITLLVMVCGHILIAQTDGCLIVKEFSPDEWKVIRGTTYFDMDDDGVYDFTYGVVTSSFMMSAPDLWSREGNCFYCIDSNQYHSVDNYFVNLNTPLNNSTLSYGDGDGMQVIYNDKNWIGHYHLDTLRYKAAIRNGTEGEYYYGWMEAYSVVTYNYDSVWFYLARTCYCTIPNYPLRWGQTSLDTSIDEPEATAFATVHPNPTNGLFTVTGKALKAAEVLNALGQRVATATGKGETLQIDIANLPAGVYFVRVTDEEGKKCVRKVVKE